MPLQVKIKLLLSANRHKLSKRCKSILSKEHHFNYDNRQVGVGLGESRFSLAQEYSSGVSQLVSLAH